MKVLDTEPLIQLQSQIPRPVAIVTMLDLVCWPVPYVKGKMGSMVSTKGVVDGDGFANRYLETCEGTNATYKVDLSLLLLDGGGDVDQIIRMSMRFLRCTLLQ